MKSTCQKSALNEGQSRYQNLALNQVMNYSQISCLLIYLHSRLIKVPWKEYLVSENVTEFALYVETFIGSVQY